MRNAASLRRCWIRGSLNDNTRHTFITVGYKDGGLHFLVGFNHSNSAPVDAMSVTNFGGSAEPTWMELLRGARC